MATRPKGDTYRAQTSSTFHEMGTPDGDEGLDRRLKLAWCGEELISARPEHDDVSRLARTHDWSVDHTRQQLATCIEAYLVDEGLKTPFQRTSPEKSPKFGDSS